MGRFEGFFEGSKSLRPPWKIPQNAPLYVLPWTKKNFPALSESVFYVPKREREGGGEREQEQKQKTKREIKRNRKRKIKIKIKIRIEREKMCGRLYF
jgi:hypothetical protein